MMALRISAGSGPSEPPTVMVDSKSPGFEPGDLPCRATPACALTAWICLVVASGAAQERPPCTLAFHRSFRIQELGLSTMPFMIAAFQISQFVSVRMIAILLDCMTMSVPSCLTSCMALASLISLMMLPLSR